ncbi:MAG: TlpA family protein disulfide reductase, partial [Pirellulales bacterium]
LMNIAEQFKDRTVDWLAIHTPSEVSFADFDRQLAEIKHRSWDDRDLPFTTVFDLALADGGTGGQTASRYGVVEWPTTIVIDQAGMVVGAVAKEDLAETIRGLLNHSD